MAVDPQAPVELSLGEFEALVAKALRGVGYSWGLAAEGARAASRLGSQGVDPTAALLETLDWADSHDGRSSDVHKAPESPSATCPILAGAALGDLRGPLPLRLESCVAPLLLVPASQRLIGAGRHLVAHTRAGSARIAPSGVSNPHLFTTGPVTLEIGEGPSTVVENTARTRILVDRSHVDRLKLLAHRTYAPATEAGRSGAGSSLSDND